MLDISTVFKGEYKICPRCKGHKYIRGQKTKTDSHLPNYKKIQRGECFLCETSGKAFFTTDNRVMKAVVAKNGNDCVLEFNPNNGDKIRLVPNYEYLNKDKLLNNNNNDNNNNNNNKTYSLTKEDLFPTMYEILWGGWYREADVIFEEYKNAKAINVHRFNEDKNGICINFLLYYNRNGKCIKPFYIVPTENDCCTIFNSYNGIVLTNENYIGVSGTYVEDKQQLTIGYLIKKFKEKESFNYYEFENIKDIKTDKNTLSKYLDTMREFSECVLDDIYDILENL